MNLPYGRATVSACDVVVIRTSDLSILKNTQ